MPSLLGILSVEQYPSFFAERYFREILTIASQTVAGHECYIRIMPPLPAQPQAAHAQLIAQGLSAALIVAPDEAFLALLDHTLAALPCAIVSAPRLDIPWSYVNSDNYGALREIVAHLAGLGRRRIRLLQPPKPTGDFLERARGYLDATSTLGLEPSIGEIDSPIDGAVLDRQVLVDAPDALIAPDDHDALTLLSLLQRRGLRVPDDIALVGFDDEDFTVETFPTLTTVSQPLAEMSRRAVIYLLDRLAGVERGIYQDILPNRLIVRESSGAQLGNR
jgi:LacI family transcriptional regulator